MNSIFKKTIVLLLCVVSSLSFAQEQNISFDTYLSYRAQKNSEHNTYDGFIEQYLNSKTSHYSMALLSELNESSRSRPSEQMLFLIENKDSIFRLIQKNIFENNFVVDFSRYQFKKKYGEDFNSISTKNETEIVNGTQCTYYNIKIGNDYYEGINEDVYSYRFCVDTKNKIDNFSILFQDSLNTKNVKGLILKLKIDGFNFYLNEQKKIKENIVVDIEQDRKLYQELRNTYLKEEEEYKAEQAEYETVTDAVEYAEDVVEEAAEAVVEDTAVEAVRDYYSIYHLKPSFCKNLYYLEIENQALKELSRSFMDNQCEKVALYKKDEESINETAFYTNLDQAVASYKNELSQSNLFTNDEVEETIKTIKSHINTYKQTDSETIDDYDF